MDKFKRLFPYKTLFWLFFLVACASGSPVLTPTPADLSYTPPAIQPDPSAQPEVSSTETTHPFEEPADIHIVDFPQAQSISVAYGVDDTLYAIYGQDENLFVIQTSDGGETFSESVLSTGDISAHVLAIERPALAVSDNGHLGVAWVELPPDYRGGNLWYAHSEDGGVTFSPGQLVATESAGETTMVEIALDAEGNPLLTWLNDSSLRYTRSLDQGVSFSTAVDIGDGSCECCQPHSTVIGETIFIAYRGLETDSQKGDIRDIVLIRSEDNGNSFEPVARVSDTHWYLPACPIAGPSLAYDNGQLYVAWMDGRFEPEGTFGRGDIWLARSEDGGKSFSQNIQINSDLTMHHTKPTIAIGPGGRIHFAWEAQGTEDDLLYYAFSDDGGQTFAPPQVIVSSAEESRGRPQMPVLVVSSSGQVTLAWIDRLGAHLAMWVDTN